MLLVVYEDALFSRIVVQNSQHITYEIKKYNGLILV